MDNSNAITIVAPKTLAETEQLSLHLAKSALLPQDIKGKREDILAVILTGAELGLAPMQSIRGIQIIKGKPSLSADLMGALCKRNREVCEVLQLVEATPLKVTYRTKRVGEKETVMSFTMEDAKAAGLTSSDMYRKYPVNMLRARCLSNICRAVYPDLCQGLYDSDSGELTDGQPTRDIRESLAPEIQELKTEKELNPTPAKPSRTEALKAKVKSSIIDVAPGETEAQAKERAQAAPLTPWEQICAIARELGATDGKAIWALVQARTGVPNWRELTEEHLAPAREALKEVYEAQAAV